MNLCSLEFGVGGSRGALAVPGEAARCLFQRLLFAHRQLGAHRLCRFRVRCGQCTQLHHAFQVHHRRGQQRLTQDLRQAAIARVAQVVAIHQLRQLPLDGRMLLTNFGVFRCLRFRLRRLVLDFVIVLDDRAALRLRIDQALLALGTTAALFLREAELQSGISSLVQSASARFHSSLTWSGANGSAASSN